MGEGEGCGNRKSDVAYLGRKLKLHLLVYIIDSSITPLQITQDFLKLEELDQIHPQFIKISEY